jgi:hypothetical protein
VAQTLGVSRSSLVEQLARQIKPRRRYRKAQDAAVLEEVRKLVKQRPTWGCRRIAAALNRQNAAAVRPRINRKRVFRLMKV